MIGKALAGAAFAAACLTAIGTMPAAQAQLVEGNGAQVITNGPQTDPGDNSGRGAAHRNVSESSQYDRLLESNRGFRAARIQKECGSISDPRLHRNCVASFGNDEPSGSSTGPRYDRGGGE